MNEMNLRLSIVLVNVLTRDLDIQFDEVNDRSRLPLLAFAGPIDFKQCVLFSKVFHMFMQV